MAVRLSRKLFAERTIPLGYGVSMTFKPFGYAQYKEAEARAHRLARERLSAAKAAELESVDNEDLGPEFNEHLVGLASEVHLDILVLTYCKGWSGVHDEPENPKAESEMGEPLPFNSDTWTAFRDQLPLIADVLDRKLAEPMVHVITEGKD